MTLIQRWKWNKIRNRIFNVAQHWYNVHVQRWNNVTSTLHNVNATVFQSCTMSFQHCFNVDMTLSQRCSNVASQHQLKLYLLPFPSFLFHPMLRYFRQFPHPQATPYCPNPINQLSLAWTNIKREILPVQLSLSIKNQFFPFKSL